MKNTVKTLLAVLSLSVALAACTPKPAAEATEETVDTTTAAPVVADTTATEVAADTTVAE